MAHSYLNSANGAPLTPFGDVASAAISIVDVLTAVPAINDVIWVHSAHSQVATATLTSPPAATPSAPQRMLCVSDFDASPTDLVSTPSGEFRLTASNSTVTFVGFWYLFGLIFDHRYTTSAGAGFNFGNTARSHRISIDKCRFQGSNDGDAFNFGASTSTSVDDVQITVNDCEFYAAGVNSLCTIRLRNGSMRFNNLSLGGTGNPAHLFTLSTTGAFSDALVENSDLSGKTYLALIDNPAGSQSRMIFRNCKMPASWVVTSTALGVGSEFIFDNCTDGATNYESRRYTYSGSVLNETTIVATTSGASDGTTPISWKMVSLAVCSVFSPLYSEWIHVWVDSTATAITPSLEVLVSGDGAAAMTDAELWIECDAMNTASTPLGTRTNDRALQVIDTGVAQAGGTTAWTGDGYTTERTHNLAVATFTPNQKGFVRCRVGLAKASTTVYVNPKIAL